MNYGRKGIHDKQLSLNARGPKWAKKLLLLIAEAVFAGIIGVGIVCAALGLGVFKGILSTAPDISKINVAPTGESSFVYDTDGKQVAKLVAANANRIPVTSEQIPDTLKKAFVAIEDERFYTHNGIDIQGIIRAAVQAVKQRGLGSGASTITQQLLKNNVFTEWTEEENNIEKIKRKIQEQYLAVQLEKTMDKDTILTYYLNTINLGSNTLGVQSASLRYFNKNVWELNLSECAVIAAITQNPSKWNPIIHPDNNWDRAEKVLDKMYAQGYITEAELNAAKKDDVYSRIKETNEVIAETSVTSYFVDALQDQLKEDLIAAGYSESQAYSLMYSGGLRIYSTQDSRIQAICDEEYLNPDNYAGDVKFLLDYALTVTKADGTLENHSSEMFRSHYREKYKKPKFNMIFKDEESIYNAIQDYQNDILMEGDEVLAEKINITPQPQVSYSVIEQSTGRVVALVGGRGTKEASRTFNRATQSTRQPGSCFKVLAAFGPAIDIGKKTIASVYNDAPFNYADGTPVVNWYGSEYRGLQSIRAGIYDSLNIVAVKTITEITPALGFNYLVNFGFTTLEEAKPIGNQIFTDIGQPLALGGLTNGVYNVELCAAYAAIANQGRYIKPTYYTKVIDSKGNVIIDKTEQPTRQVISEQTAYILTNAMEDTLKIGTATTARFSGMSIAGKTGTTSDERDIWFVGYTPYYTAAGWTGYDNNEVLTTAEQKLCKQIFKATMSRIHEGMEDPGFPVPANMVHVTVCSKSGKLPVPGLCDACLKSELFSADNIPTEYCDVHYAGRICGYDNLRATEYYCPFAYDGVCEMLPVEDESLWQGSTVIASELDPLNAGTVIQEAVTSGYCHHDEAFFAQPDWEAKLAQENAEYAVRVAAAQAAAEAAAAAGQ